MIQRHGLLGLLFVIEELGAQTPPTNRQRSTFVVLAEMYIWVIIFIWNR